MLNHIRLKHRREIASHDECIQQCATLVPEAERIWVIQHGIEVTGMSMSMRRLFEMALGSGEAIFQSNSSSHFKSEDAEMLPVSDSPDPLDTMTPATHLSKTLGHHKDTPELAQFLGRVPRRRVINVYDSSEIVDIQTGATDDSYMGTGSWRMSYNPRSTVNIKTGDVDAQEEKDDPSAAAVTSSSILAGSLDGIELGSRFHMTARLVITDWSMKMPGNAALGEITTHKWMIAVHSPTYVRALIVYLINHQLIVIVFRPYMLAVILHGYLLFKETILMHLPSL